MLRQSLRTLGVDTPALLDAADIEPSARAEDLAVDAYVRLARCLADLERSG
jgi:16S rRNA (adenine1518-N6/adenine1519-N6)-dimethyltransferase